MFEYAITQSINKGSTFFKLIFFCLLRHNKWWLQWNCFSGNFSWLQLFMCEIWSFLPQNTWWDRERGHHAFQLLYHSHCWAYVTIRPHHGVFFSKLNLRPPFLCWSKIWLYLFRGSFILIASNCIKNGNDLIFYVVFFFWNK